MVTFKLRTARPLIYRDLSGEELQERLGKLHLSEHELEKAITEEI